MGNTQTADARFLRRIMMILIVLTLGSGVMAGVATVNAMQAQAAGHCGVAGLSCQN